MMQQLDSAKRIQQFDEAWYVKPGLFDLSADLRGEKGKCVNLPHDYMIEQDVSADAPAGPAMGYYNAGTANYTKKVVIPSEWEGDEVLLHFDGVMMNAVVEVNGGRTALHHYGYTPFDVDITPYIYWGRENRVTVTCNPGLQPNSRWYSGAGIYRHVTIERRSRLHIATDGIYAHTDMLEDEAHILIEVTAQNHTGRDLLVEVEAVLSPETFQGESISRTVRAFVKTQGQTVVRVPMTVYQPILWDDEHPELYKVTANIKEKGTFGAGLLESHDDAIADSKSVLFGIRMVQADPVHGLRINGNSVKLKGGCIHHDNGILGAVSFYDSELRKLSAMKAVGYNAVRTAHNPPSKELLEVCDRLGLYVIDEAFDCWGTPKNPGDYSQYFDADWQGDVEAFMKRDRNHPSVILWSTGNEIPERGGLGGGYELAAKVAEYMRKLDGTRLITNGLCSFWSGLDDEAAIEQQKAFQAASGGSGLVQNAPAGNAGGLFNTSLEERSEPFVNMLDVVGYNYMDEHYEKHGDLYPERVIVGTESFPINMINVWGLVERLPYVIGDFTWTSVDYIGEAGIGKSIFAPPGDPALKEGPFSLMSHSSRFPWRLANDADIDIVGEILPQGAMRKLLWGGSDTTLYVVDPCHYGEEELVSPWGWPDIKANWCLGKDYIGKPVKVIVYSPGDTVALYLGEELIGEAAVENYTATFDTIYRPGKLRAVSRRNGETISEGALESAGEKSGLRLIPDQQEIAADGDSLCYIAVQIIDDGGRILRDSQAKLSVRVDGAGTLAGFGSAAAITSENYTIGAFSAYQGKAMAIVRSGYEKGEVNITVSDGSVEQTVTIKVV